MFWRIIPFTVIAIFLVTTSVISAAEPARFALLVGVGKYTNLPPARQLSGTANDVRLMRELLESRFGFPPSNIHMLQDEAATGEAIRAAFERIIKSVNELPTEAQPAEIVFHFSGHGGQLPDQPIDGRDEYDGLDETLVPADATMIGGEEDIRDDELNRLAYSICAEGKAKLWMILDCCHSGTGTRGTPQAGIPGLTGYRTLPRDIIPTTSQISPVVNTLPVGAVALYACRDQELEPEYFDGQQSYGLLTRFLTSVLMDAPEGSHFSYAGLRDAVAARYRQDRDISLSAPVPQVEGTAELLNTSILGNGPLPSPKYWKLKAGSNNPTLLAGAFHGITKDCIFQLHESPEVIIKNNQDDLKQLTEKDAAAGFARVVAVEGASSSLEFVQWDGKNWQQARWPRNLIHAYATLHSRGNNDFGLRVFVSEATTANSEKTLKPAPLPPRLKNIFVKGSPDEKTDDWLSMVTNHNEADVIIQIAGTQIRAFPAPGPVSRGTSLTLAHSGGWGPIDLQAENASAQIVKLLRRIARAKNLLRVAAHGLSGGIRPVHLELELLAHDPDNPSSEMKPWPNDTPGKLPASLVMRSGDCYQYRITNHGNQPVYISVLHVNSNMGIEQVFPYQSGSEIEGADDAQLRPGESRIEGPFQCNGIGLPNLGQRHTVVLATVKPNSFYMLNQPSLPSVRSLGESDSLTDLLMSGTYFKTRSRRRPVQLFDNSWGAAMIQWDVQP